LNVDAVQLMRELEKVVRPNVAHFNVIDANTTVGTQLLLLCRTCISNQSIKQ